MSGHQEAGCVPWVSACLWGTIQHLNIAKAQFTQAMPPRGTWSTSCPLEASVGASCAGCTLLKNSPIQRNSKLWACSQSPLCITWAAQRGWSRTDACTYSKPFVHLLPYSPFFFRNRVSLCYCKVTFPSVQFTSIDLKTMIMKVRFANIAFRQHSLSPTCKMYTQLLWTKVPAEVWTIVRQSYSGSQQRPVNGLCHHLPIKCPVLRPC